MSSSSSTSPAPALAAKQRKKAKKNSGGAAAVTESHAADVEEMPDEDIPPPSGSTLFISTDLFDETRIQDYLCAICSHVMKDAVEIPIEGCGHAFCDKCLGDWLKKKANCPICDCGVTKRGATGIGKQRRDSDSDTEEDLRAKKGSVVVSSSTPTGSCMGTWNVYPSHFIRRQIANFAIHCLHAKDGCKWTGCLELSHDGLHKHLHTKCYYHSKPCPWDESHEHLKKDEWEKHKKECLARLVECDQCGLKKPLRDHDKHKLEDCEDQLVQCKHGCAAIEEKKEDDTAMRDEPVSVPKPKISKPSSPIKRLLCKEVVEDSLDELPTLLPITRIKRRLLQHHYDHDCPKEKIPCSFAFVGCTAMIARGELPAHDRDCMTAHVDMMKAKCERMGREERVSRQVLIQESMARPCIDFPRLIPFLRSPTFYTQRNWYNQLVPGDLVDHRFGSYDSATPESDNDDATWWHLAVVTIVSADDLGSNSIKLDVLRFSDNKVSRLSASHQCVKPPFSRCLENTCPQIQTHWMGVMAGVVNLARQDLVNVRDGGRSSNVAFKGEFMDNVVRAWRGVFERE